MQLAPFAHARRRQEAFLQVALQPIAAERLARLLSDYVLRFAARDTSTTFNRALGVRPAAKRFLDETRAAFSGGGVSWEQWLSLWHALDFSSLPAFHLWERDVFRALSKTFGVLLRVYSCYAKRALHGHEAISR